MSVMKTVLIAGIGITAGMVVANYLTDGAVFEAASDLITNAKGRFVEKTQDVVDVVADATEAVADAV